MRRLILLFSAFLAVNVYATGTLQSERYFANNGGLIDHISPLLIPDKNASSITNITLDDRGPLTKRTGYTIINTTGSLMTNAITGGSYHSASTGNSFFAVIAGTNVYTTGNTFNGTFTNVIGTVTVTASNTNLAQATNLNDKLIFCNETDKPFKVPTSGNATPLGSSVFTGAKTCTTYGSYLILANTTESAVSYPSRIRWSDVNNPDSFPSNNYWDAEPDDGDAIVSVTSFEDSVYVFKKHSIYRILITGLDGADAFVVRPVSRNIGAWAKNSVKVIPNVGIAFLSQNTVYVLSDNGLEPIGDPIQRTLDAVNRSKWAYSVGEVYAKRYQYWLAVSPSGSTNGQVLVYDYIQKAWTVYTGMTVDMLAQAEDSTGASILLSGDYTGNVYKQDSGTSDNPAAVATAISASYTTADLTLGTPEFTKNFKYLYLFSKIDSTTSVTVNVFYDYATTAVAFNTTLSIGVTPAIYGTAVYGTDIYPSGTTAVSRVELNRSARALKLQFLSASTSSNLGILGWVFVYSNEDYKQ